MQGVLGEKGVEEGLMQGRRLGGSHCSHLGFAGYGL